MQTEVSKTKMIQGSTKKIKLEVLRTYQHASGLLQPGSILEVDQDEAKQLLSLKVQGQYDFSGERNEVVKLPWIYYFKVLKEPSVMDELEKIQNS